MNQIDLWVDLRLPKLFMYAGVKYLIIKTFSNSTIEEEEEGSISSIIYELYDDSGCVLS